MRDASTGRHVLEAEASLAADSDTSEQDGDADPQARDERPIVIGSKEHTDEPSRSDIEEWREAYKENPLIRVPIQNFASDVTEPGVSVVVSTPKNSDVPTVPDDYWDDTYVGKDLDDALEHWLANCYIDGWDFDADLSDLLDAVVKDRRGRRGTAVVEHAYDDATERQRILGLRPIKVETMTAYTREGKGIALRPDDDLDSFDSIAVQDLDDNDRDQAPTTPAGHTAALAQYDDVFGTSERDEIPFALDDVTVSAYDPDTGELFGQPDSAGVVDRAQAVYAKFEHIDQAVLNQAFANIIAKVETDDKELAKSLRDDLDVNSPQTVSGTNVPVELEQVEGSVPDAVAQIQQEIEYVLTAMPTPLYRVGFAGDINRDITGEQREDYRDQVKRERARLEADFATVLTLKAREFLHGDAHGDEQLDVTPELRIRPADAESPLRDEEFDADAFKTLMDGLSTAAGPKGGAEAMIPKQNIIETFLDMDADEVLTGEADLSGLDESDPRVREAFDEFTGAELADDFEQPRDTEGEFAEVPDPPDPDTLNEEKTWLIGSSLPDGSVARAGFTKKGGEGDMDKFTIIYEALVGGEYKPVAQYDHNSLPSATDQEHDVTEEGLHVDKYISNSAKTKDEELTNPLSGTEAFEQALKHLNQHDEEWLRRFRENHGSE